MYTIAPSTNKWEILSPQVPQVVGMFGQKVGWGPSEKLHPLNPTSTVSSPAKTIDYLVPPSGVCIRIFARVV
jgi:hypothetical protein